MPDLFFSFGGHNYARYLTFFSQFIANLDFSHPGAVNEIKLGVISVARSFIPGNRCAVDKTMEETFMKHAKSKAGAGAGISGITQNHGAYQRWVKTTHQRSKYISAAYALAHMEGHKGQSIHHKDLRPAEIQKSEKAVQAAMDAINSFLNPFSLSDVDHLYNLSSGCTMTEDIKADVLASESFGKEEKEKFIDGRLVKNDHFFSPIKKLKLKTMASSNKKVNVTSRKNKVLEVKQHSNIAFQLIVKSRSLGRVIDLQHDLEYQLTTVPFLLGTTD